MRIDWKTLLALIGILLLLIHFADIMEYIRKSSPFAGLNHLPYEQRNLIVLGIIIVTSLIIYEVRKGR